MHQGTLLAVHLGGSKMLDALRIGRLFGRKR